jgi:hypothetical protein
VIRATGKIKPATRRPFGEVRKIVEQTLRQQMETSLLQKELASARAKAKVDCVKPWTWTPTAEKSPSPATSAAKATTDA